VLLQYLKGWVQYFSMEVVINKCFLNSDKKIWHGFGKLETVL